MSLLCLVVRLSSADGDHASCPEHLRALRDYTASDDGSLEVERAGDHLEFVKHAHSAVI